ncbi:MAG TPA: hypothetical protein VFS33_04185, partial [Gemmatimonadales bacterium]|nr:hypothetical protein [Gemmatimonadales bacterium]
MTVTVTYSTGNTPGSGQVKLTANGVYSTSASAAYTVPILSFGVAVDPLSPSTAQRESGQSYSDVFNVRNTGSTNTTFTVSCSATGLTCNYPTTQVPVNAASTVAVTVPYTAGSVGTGGLTLTAVGTNTVTGATYSGTGAYTVPIVRHAVAVTPDGVFAPTRLTTGGPYIDSVLVQNTGTVADTYSLTCTQTGAVNGCGILGATSLSLAPNASAWIKATYSVSATAVDSGVLTVRAASNYAADVGSYKVVAAASTPQPPAVSAADGMPGATVERPLCLTIALGAAAAAECGDLRVVHALPATRTMNKSRVPMLLYNSQFAHPYPVIAANVTLPATALTPDRVTASLKVNGVPPGAGITQGEWSGNEWGPGRTRRIALTFDGLGYATGLHPYTVEVINWYGTNAQTTTFTGVVAIVNRSASPMGAGWWLAGLEQLVKVTPDTVVWVGGDGSVREYIARISDTVWGAPNVDYPDSLRRDPNTGLIVRYGRDSVWVTFDAAGHHVRTRNRQNHVTTFGYVSDRLTSIDLPVPAGGTPRSYQFQYLGGKLQSVVAPGPTATTSRTVMVTINPLGQLTTIQDPDSTVVAFGYDPIVTHLLRTRTNRLGTVTGFAFDSGMKVRQDSLDMSAVGKPPIVKRYRMLESLGLPNSGPQSSVDTAAVYTRIDGARPDSDVYDTTAVWVDRLGAVRKTADAAKNITLISRRDPNWPALVTSVVYPNGFTVDATYDTRGRLSTSVERNPLGDGRDATTTYVWDAKWDALTSITRPEQDGITFGVDPVNGNRKWQRDGRGSATQVDYGYNAANQVETITLPPVGGTTAATETLGYDNLGNLNLVTSPLGRQVQIANDLAGRTAKRRTQINGAATLWQTDTLVYDSKDRVVREEVTGDSMNQAPKQTTIVRTGYTLEGQVERLIRSVTPDPALLGDMTTVFAYDPAGRKVAEFAPDHLPSPGAERVDSFFYDPAGNLIQSKNRLQQSVWRHYDALNRVDTVRTETVQYAYRFDGIPKKLASGPDSAISVCRENFTGSSKPELCKTYPRLPNDGARGYKIAADTAVFAYDAMGRMTRADNRAARVHRQYFRGGALQRDSLYIATWAQPGLDGDFTAHRYGLEFSYDRNGRRRTLTHPLQFGHLLGDPSGTTTSVESFTYNAGDGGLDTVTSPTGVTWTIQRNVRGELATVSTVLGGTTVQRKLAYDNDGNFVGDTIMKGSVAERQATMGYDARGLMTSLVNATGAQDRLYLWHSGLGHLVADTLTAVGLNPFGDRITYQAFETYRLDPLGNRLYVNTASQIMLPGNPQVFPQGRTEQNFTYQRLTGRHIQAAIPSGTQKDTTYYDVAGNIVFTTQTPSVQDDRASYYASDGRLAASDWRRTLNSPPTSNQDGRYVFEEYRYDALGRRVLVHADRGCKAVLPPYDTECKLSWIRRTVWDGANELWEVQMPFNVPVAGDTTYLENDTLPVI